MSKGHFLYWQMKGLLFFFFKLTPCDSDSGLKENRNKKCTIVPTDLEICHVSLFCSPKGDREEDTTASCRQSAFLFTMLGQDIRLLFKFLQMHSCGKEEEV